VTPSARVSRLPHKLAEPIVYATLGTTSKLEPGLWAMVLDGLERTGLSVVATVGREMDPASLRPRPPRMRIERFVPQRFVLDRCAAAVTHGGYGSLMGCLARGVPVVSVPIAAGDDVPNATRVAGLGAGLAVLPNERSSERIAEAVERVVGDSSYRRNALAVAAEIEHESPAHAGSQLEDQIARIGAADHVAERHVPPVTTRLRVRGQIGEVVAGQGVDEA
jgi:MGT family glycosyltransferase